MMETSASYEARSAPSSYPTVPWSFYISEEVDRSKSAELAKFSGSHRADALYQGTTLVGPFRRNKDQGFSPCAFFFAR
jgi:hypothetical protein